ncbi:hypothetical protein MKX03_027919 [Papaver bracteatum]|nr:hypothetical protein MKX03_027919 [Papaver bracteatum]
MPPGKTFFYKFVADRPWNYGSIQVAVPEQALLDDDYEISIILDDWCHEGTYELAAGLASKSLLIRGRVRENYLVKNFKLHIFFCTKFRNRGHNMTVLEADGHFAEPFIARNLNIYPGKTYFVLMKTDQDPSKIYWVAFNVIGGKPATPTHLAILNYDPNYNHKPPTSTPPAVRFWPLWSNFSQSTHLGRN